MPTREPTFYRWSQDKPCTTNQTYGYELRLGLSGSNTLGTNCGHNKNKNKSSGEPAEASRSHAAHQRKQIDDRSSTDRSATTSCKPINRGYVMGYVPVTKKMAKGREAAMSGVMLKRDAGRPAAYSAPQQSGQDMYLWHALSGTLVHCKNYDSPSADDY